MVQVKLNMSGHKNLELAVQGFQDLSLHVDLNDPELGSKVAGILSPRCGEGDQATIVAEAKIDIDSGDVVTLALPGLAPLAVITIVVIHGLTGNFPLVQTLVRQSNGSFAPGPIVDLQTLRNDVVRKRHRNDVVVL